MAEPEQQEPSPWIIDKTKEEVAVKVVSELRTGSTKYSTSAPEDYRWARKQFADEFGVTQSDLTYRINALAEEWKKENGDYPSGFDLYRWDMARNSIYTFAQGFGALPSRFGVSNPNGTTDYYYNDPVYGLREDAISSRLPAEDAAARTQTMYTPDDLSSILAGLSPVNAPSGGGGGRGSGASRTPMVWDRKQLVEGARERWRGLLLEDPGDDELSRHVTDFISEANGFWMKQGGRLDFDTFIVDRIRATERHKQLYKQKPEFQSETEYMTQYRSAVSQFGLAGSAANREIEAGLRSGAGIQGFTERVGRTREARIADQGSLSQRFAATAAQMGLGRT